MKDWMLDQYYTFRLWYWWNYVINEDEFSPKLGYWQTRERELNRSSKDLSIKTLNMIIIKQRNVAHELDTGNMKVSDFLRIQIKTARI